MQFNKSLSEVNNSKNSDAELEEHIFQCFKTRYGVSEKTMKLFEQFIFTVKQHMKYDQRLDHLAKFMPSLQPVEKGLTEFEKELFLQRKHPKDAFEIFLKFVKAMDLSLNQILIEEQSEEIIWEVKDIFRTMESSVYYNASIPIKMQLLRSLLYDCDLYINGKLRQAKNASLAEKMELYILCDFQETLREKEGGEGDLVHILEKQCKSTN